MGPIGLATRTPRWVQRQVFAAAAACCVLSAAGAAKSCDVPVFATGQVLNSSKELTQFLKRHKHVLVGFSARSCSECCQWESEYQAASSLLPKGVKWVRVDMDQHSAKPLATSHDIGILPSIIFFNERKPIRLLEPHWQQNLLGMAQRSLQPLPRLPRDGLAEWLSLANADRGEVISKSSAAVTFEQSIRMLALLKGSESQELAEEDEEAEELTEAARAWAGRPLSVRFAYTFRQKLREEMAQHPAVLAAGCSAAVRTGRAILIAASLFNGEYIEAARFSHDKGGHAQSGFFRLYVHREVPLRDGLVLNSSTVSTQTSSNDDITHEIVVLPRVVCHTHDSYSELSVDTWLLRASLPPVGRFDSTTSSLYEKTQKPILMLFTDTEHPKLASWLKLLFDSHAKVNGGTSQATASLRVIFTYIDSYEHLSRMTSLGLVADTRRLPALCFNYVTDQVLTWQPAAESYADGTAVLSSKIVDSLVQRFLSGDSEEIKDETPLPKAVPVPKRNTAKGEERKVPNLAGLGLQERLRFVEAVNLEAFKATVFDSSKDVAVYFYVSHGKAEVESMEHAIYVNRVAERLAELALDTVKLMRMDLASSSLPMGVTVSYVPSIVLFPAFSKDPPYHVIHKEFKVANILWWLQEHCSLKFGLPDLPQFDELEAERYFAQKAMLSPQEQARAEQLHEKPRRQGKGKGAATQEL